MSKKPSTKQRKTLVIDVGGTNLKVGMTGQKDLLKIPSGSEMTAAKMAAAVRSATAGWKYDSVSIGYPGPVKDGKPAREPHNLAGGWVRFDYEKAFGAPSDRQRAAMQALDSPAAHAVSRARHRPRVGARRRACSPLELAHLPCGRARHENASV